VYIIKEAKQVGILYHFTTINNLEDILKSKGLKSDFFDYISFTRNFNLQKTSDYFKDHKVRLTFDGNKLSNKYKIEPFIDNVGKITRKYGEYEERILWPSGKLLPCFFTLKQIDIEKGISREDFKANVPINYVWSFKPYRRK